MNKKLIVPISILVALTIVIIIFLSDSKPPPPRTDNEFLLIQDTTPRIVFNEYGIRPDLYVEEEGRVQRNQNLSLILSSFNISATVIHEIANYSKDLFDAARIRTGNTYRLFLTNDSLQTPAYFIYEYDPVDYVKVKLHDEISIERGSKEIKKVVRSGAGEINSSLWNSMISSELPTILAIELSYVYAWSVDFFRLQRGDEFRLFYEVNYVDTNYVGINNIQAAWFKHMGREFYAIPFEQDSTISFFDTEGNSLRRAFLKAPLRYSRISSGYSNSRLHPILGIRRPHHGIDYAAPSGTPVYAIGDGRITQASYDGNNGNMIRIHHNSVYTSAYLHLRNFASGIRSNVWVNQGDLIGYVGSTGLSTGPHLDFRIWQNGQPVDPRTIESPPVEPIKDENREEFYSIRDSWIEKLDNLIID